MSRRWRNSRLKETHRDVTTLENELERAREQIEQMMDEFMKDDLVHPALVTVRRNVIVAGNTLAGLAISLAREDEAE